MRRLYVLQGECIRCGDCCIGGDDPFDGAHGEPEIPGMCPALRKGPDGTRICIDHGKPDTYWDRGCRTWPSKPEHLAQSHMSRCTLHLVPVK